MKALRTLFWCIVAVIFGALAGIIIGGITLAAGFLILYDLLFRRSTNNRQPTTDN